MSGGGINGSLSAASLESLTKTLMAPLPPIPDGPPAAVAASGTTLRPTKEEASAVDATVAAPVEPVKHAVSLPGEEKPIEASVAPTATGNVGISGASEVPTLYLKQNLRSGKTVRFDGNIIIIGDVHAGSEITATGDITVWGELKGIAHAGSNGNYRAEIRALRIEAIQLRIADYIARRPDRIYYHKDLDGQWAAELAKVADGEIKIVQELIGR
jgi:septum site-determining protein MinC